MKKFINYIGAATLASSLLFTGCSSLNQEPVYGSDSNTETDTALIPYEQCLSLISPKAYSDADGLTLESGSVISMITPTSSTPYWDAVKNGAIQAIEDINTSLGYSGKDRITLSFNTASNVDDQINILDSELSRYPAAIALAPLDTIAFGMQFDQAMENGIPIITFETATTNSNVTSVVGTNHEQSTYELLEQLTELSDSPELTFIITSDALDNQNKSRLQYTREFLSEYDKNFDENLILDLSNLDAIHHNMYLQEQSLLDAVPDDASEALDEKIDTDGATEYSDNESDPSDEVELVSYKYTVSETFEYLLSAFPECQNLVFLDGSACESILPELDSLQLDYDNYNLLSFDTSNILKQALVDEKIDGLQITNPYGMGYASIIASIRASLDLGNEAFVNSGDLFFNSNSSDDIIYTDFFY